MPPTTPAESEAKQSPAQHLEFDNGPSAAQVSDRHGEATKVVHADGTTDYVDAHILGGEVERMPSGYFRSPQFLGTVLAQCLASIAAYLGWVLPANTLSLINEDIGPSADITWASTIWTMGSSIGFLLVGRLSDLLGRKWMVQSTSALSLIGCILGGSARNVTMLIVGMGCSGVGAAGQLSFGITLGELVPNKLRGLVTALAFMSSLPFAAFGPIIGRVLIADTGQGWRWSFYMGIIINVIVIVLYHFLYHPPSFSQLHVGRTRIQQARQLDWIGMLLFISGCVLFLIGISWGGQTYPWKSAEVLCPLLVGAATFCVFFIYEAYFCHVTPLMPPRMFRNVGFDAVVAIATVGSMVYYSLTVLWPSIISSLYETDSIQVGWQSCVVGGGVLAGQIMGGLGLSYVPRVKFQCITAALLLIAFMTALTSLSPDRWAATIAFGVFGCTAAGYVENISFPGVTLLWEPQDIGLATGILGSMRGLGGAIAQTMYTCIYTNKYSDYLTEYVTPAAVDAGLPRSSVAPLLAGISGGDYSSVKGMTGDIATAVSEALVEANTHAFRMVFYATIPFTVLVLVSSIFVPDFERFLTRDVAKRLQDDQFREENKTDRIRRCENVV